MKKLLVDFGFNALEMGLCFSLILIAGVGTASLTKSNPATLAVMIPSACIAVVASEKAVKKLRKSQ